MHGISSGWSSCAAMAQRPGRKRSSVNCMSSGLCKDGCNIRLERCHARRPDLRNP